MSAKIPALLGAIVVLAGALAVWRPWEAPDVAAIAATAPEGPRIDGDGATELAGAVGPNAGPESERAVAALADARGEPGVGTILYGWVRAVDGTPVTGGTVSIRGAAGERSHAELDERAAYSIPGLAAGAWTLTADARGFLPCESSVTVLPGVEAQRHDLVLTASWTVLIKILGPGGELLRAGVEDGIAAGGARLIAVATESRPGGALPLITHMDHLHYGVGVYTGRERFGREDRIPPGATGLLEVRADHAVFVSLVLRHLVLQSQIVQPGQREALFQVEANAVASRLGTVRARIVEARSGAPLDQARVALNTAETSGGGLPVDAEGRIELEEVPPGWMELEVRAPEHAFHRELVVVEPGAVTDVGEVAVPRAARIAGRVVDAANGRPVALGLSYTPLDFVDCPEAFEFQHGLRTKTDGVLELTAVAQGRVLVRPDRGSEWAANGTVIDASAGDVEGAVVTLERGRPVTLRFELARPSRYQWWLHEQGGDPVTSGTVRESGPQEVRLVKGAYRLELWSGKSLLTAVGFEVGEASDAVALAY